MVLFFGFSRVHVGVVSGSAHPGHALKCGTHRYAPRVSPPPRRQRGLGLFSMLFSSPSNNNTPRNDPPGDLGSAPVDVPDTTFLNRAHFDEGYDDDEPFASVSSSTPSVSPIESKASPVVAEPPSAAGPEIVVSSSVEDLPDLNLFRSLLGIPNPVTELSETIPSVVDEPAAVLEEPAAVLEEPAAVLEGLTAMVEETATVVDETVGLGGAAVEEAVGVGNDLAKEAIAIADDVSDEAVNVAEDISTIVEELVNTDAVVDKFESEQSVAEAVKKDVMAEIDLQSKVVHDSAEEVSVAPWTERDSDEAAGVLKAPVSDGNSETRESAAAVPEAVVDSTVDAVSAPAEVESVNVPDDVFEKTSASVEEVAEESASPIETKEQLPGPSAVSPGESEPSFEVDAPAPQIADSNLKVKETFAEAVARPTGFMRKVAARLGIGMGLKITTVRDLSESSNTEDDAPVVSTEGNSAVAAAAAATGAAFGTAITGVSTTTEPQTVKIPKRDVGISTSAAPVTEERVVRTTVADGFPTNTSSPLQAPESLEGISVASGVENSSSRPPRDPRRVMVVGASGRVGRALVKALNESSSRYYVVGVTRDTPDEEVEGCSRMLSIDAATDSARVAEEAILLGCGSVVWCASAGPRGSPRDVDYAAVRTVVESMGSGICPDSTGSVSQHWLADTKDVVSVVDLATDEGRTAFCPIDDVIMGGKSSSHVRGGDIREDTGAPAVWYGDISLSNRGGFVSVRASLADEAGNGVDLSGCAGIALTCRGDGKRYKLNLKNSDKPEFVFQAAFDTESNGQWQTIRIPFSEFVPVIRGKLAYANDGSGVYASALKTSSIMSVGLVCSKVEPGGLLCPKFKEGPFRLDLARVDGYRYSVPRFVLVSSAAVTRPFWSEEKADLYPNASSIPIVKLNASIGNILGAKLAGEDALRVSGIPYSVVRPTGLADDAVKNCDVLVSKGDFATGRIAVGDVAAAVIEVLGSEEATWKTVEITGNPGVEWNPDNFATQLKRLPLDHEQVLYPGNSDEL